MAKLSKRVRAFREKVDPAKIYPVTEAVTILNELSSVKFKESIDVSINLGVDPRKSDQVVRGATVLPNGTGGLYGHIHCFTNFKRTWQLSREGCRLAANDIGFAHSACCALQRVQATFFFSTAANPTYI